jgi:hypothetical protein
MSFRIPINRPRAARQYSCFIEGVPVTRSFLHGTGLSPGALSRELNRQFQEWLEHIAPGAQAAGQVTGIKFADTEEWAFDEGYTRASAQGITRSDRV